MSFSPEKPIVEKPTEEMTNAELWAVFFEYLTDKEKEGKLIIVRYLLSE